MRYTLHVNGQDHTVDVDSDTPLLWVLRDAIDLKGTKYGCGAGLCGACTVHINGTAMPSCRVRVSDVGNSAITTIEGVGQTPVGARLKAAWLEVDVPQCGYCQAGQIMTASSLLEQNPSPSDADIVAAMNGNLCRCGTYTRIVEAIKRAAKDNAASAADRKGA